MRKDCTEKIHKIGYPITIGEKKEIKGSPAMYYKTLLNLFYNNLISTLNDKNIILYYPFIYIFKIKKKFSFIKLFNLYSNNS